MGDQEDMVVDHPVEVVEDTLVEEEITEDLNQEEDQEDMVPEEDLDQVVENHRFRSILLLAQSNRIYFWLILISMFSSYHHYHQYHSLASKNLNNLPICISF